MGVHILIIDKDDIHTSHPTWDTLRQGDDSHNARALCDNSQELRLDDHGELMILLRPDCATDLRGDRGAELRAIMESDPRWWVDLVW